MDQYERESMPEPCLQPHPSSRATSAHSSPVTGDCQWPTDCLRSRSPISWTTHPPAQRSELSTPTSMRPLTFRTTDKFQWSGGYDFCLTSEVRTRCIVYVYTEGSWFDFQAETLALHCPINFFSALLHTPWLCLLLILCDRMRAFSSYMYTKACTYV